MDLLRDDHLPNGAASDRLREEVKAWRQVAHEREEACEELERINHWLEQENQRLERALDEFRRPPAPPLQAQVPPEIATGQPSSAGGLKPRLAYYLRFVFPPGTLHGRAVRRGARVALRLIRRAS